MSTFGLRPQVNRSLKYLCQGILAFASEWKIWSNVRSVLSFSTLGTLMADEADSRPACPTTAAAGECLVWGEHSLDTVFPPCPFSLQASTAVHFKGAGGLVDGMAPSASVSSLGSPVPWVDATGSEGLL